MAIKTFGTVKKLTIMNKQTDFRPFLAKEFKMSDAPEITETNTIKDEVFKKGLLKTVIMAGNGVFEAQDSKYGFSVKNQGGNYPGLGAAYDSLADGLFITHNPAPKIPQRALDTVIEWYRRITDESDEEAQVVFYYNEFDKKTIENEQGIEVTIEDIPGVHYWTEKLFSYTPRQYNTKAHTQADDHFYDEFNRVFGMYVETHSHNSMDAFASGEDEANSENDGFQLVFGKLNTEHPVMYSWATMNEIMKKGLSADELNTIMDFNPSSRYDETAEKLVYTRSQLDFDESLFDEWDAQVKIRPVRTYTYAQTGPYAHQGWGTGYSTGYTAGATSVYTRLTKADEIALVQETFDGNLSLDDKPTFSFDEVAELVSKAFMTGYQVKDDNPYVNNYNKARLIADIEKNSMF